MALRRLLLAVLVCAAVGGALSGRALAVTPPLPACAAAGGNELVTQHFNIWYDSDQGQSDYITETKAGDVGGFAEHAYSTFAAMGFPTPVVGASGRIDIEVVDLSNWHRTTVVCTNGQFLLDSKSIGTSDQLMFAIGAGVFSEIEYKQFVPATTDLWLTGAAAQWASALALGYPAVSAADLGPPEMSLDCWDPNYTVDLRKCSAEQAASYENIGLSRWPFFEYLAERFGNMFIDEVLADSASAGSSYQGIANALAAHGTTFSAAFNDWTKTDLSGAYTAAPLQNHVPPTYVTVSTGTVAGTVANKLRVTVDHLATRYVEFDRGDGTGASSCFAAKLSLTVTIPAGSISQPMFYWTGGGGTVVPLSINGSTATATVPWDTCTWGGAKGLLALTNASSNPDVNSANFYVTATMTVDSTTPANAGAPPTPVSVWGQVVPVTSNTLPPAITLDGKAVLTLSSTDRVLSLIIESDGQGSVQVSLGSTPLGTVNVVPGTNLVSLTLPSGVLDTLRRSAGASDILTVTPVAASGAGLGQTVTRKVMIAPAAKPKAKPAAKPKSKPKTKTKTKHKTGHK
jgi:hypothetical protein